MARGYGNHRGRGGYRNNNSYNGRDNNNNNGGGGGGFFSTSNQGGGGSHHSRDGRGGYSGGRGYRGGYSGGGGYRGGYNNSTSRGGYNNNNKPDHVAIKEDMEERRKSAGSFWPLSCYSPRTTRDKPVNKLQGDTSFEELRWFTTSSIAQGKPAPAVLHEVDRGFQAKMDDFGALAQGKKAFQARRVATHSPFASPARAGGLAAPAGGAFASPTPSAFAPAPAPAFGQALGQAPAGAFAQAPPAGFATPQAQGFQPHGFASPGQPQPLPAVGQPFAASPATPVGQPFPGTAPVPVPAPAAASPAPAAPAVSGAGDDAAWAADRFPVGRIPEAAPAENWCR